MWPFHGWMSDMILYRELAIGIMRILDKSFSAASGKD